MAYLGKQLGTANLVDSGIMATAAETFEAIVENAVEAELATV